MSAICGIFNLDGRPVLPELMDRMMSAMDYWGPDGASVRREGAAALGHLMLRSTPESENESLPAADESGNVIITANARLDNRDELFSKLRMQPSERSQIPDSRLVLQAYSKWGRACPEHLLGDWSFAIWDKSRQELFIARDHHGNNGLYYYRGQRFFAFASCLKGLLALPDVPREPNPLRIAQILVSWPEHGEATCYRGLKRLPPAHLMTVTSENTAATQYWFLENTPRLRLGSDREYLEAFGEIYSEAVRCRLRSRKPVGVTLSGGFDSGSVAALAARELDRTGQRLQAFGAVPLYDVAGLIPSRRTGDETPLIEAAARQAGNIDVTYVRAADTSPLRGIERGLELHDEPGHAASNQFWIVSLLGAAQAQGLGAILTGQGGNATVSWHAPGRLAALASQWQWRLLWHELTAMKNATQRPAWRLIAGRIAKPLLLDPLRGNFRRLCPVSQPWMRYSAINRRFASECKIAERMRKAGHDPGFGIISDQRKARLRIINPGKSIIGCLWQESGAGYGLEVRDPTLDKRVMEFCLSIPDEQHARDGLGRLLIRRSMREIMSPVVLDNRRGGIQAADLVKRLRANFDETEFALQRVARSESACHYLDIPLMRRSLMQARDHQSAKLTANLISVFFRGLMVGMFLQRLD